MTAQMRRLQFEQFQTARYGFKFPDLPVADDKLPQLLPGDEAIQQFRDQLAVAVQIASFFPNPAVVILKLTALEERVLKMRADDSDGLLDYTRRITQLENLISSAELPPKLSYKWETVADRGRRARRLALLGRAMTAIDDPEMDDDVEFRRFRQQLVDVFSLPNTQYDDESNERMKLSYTVAELLGVSLEDEKFNKHLTEARVRFGEALNPYTAAIDQVEAALFEIEKTIPPDVNLTNERFKEACAELTSIARSYGMSDAMTACVRSIQGAARRRNNILLPPRYIFEHYAIRVAMLAADLIAANRATVRRPNHRAMVQMQRNSRASIEAFANEIATTFVQQKRQNEGL